MKTLSLKKWTGALLLVAGLGYAPSSWACAACYGQSNSSLAVGMNWGIAVLMVFVLGVLASVAGFAIYLVRKSNAFAKAEAEAAALEHAMASAQKA